MRGSRLLKVGDPHFPIPLVSGAPVARAGAPVAETKVGHTILKWSCASKAKCTAWSWSKVLRAPGFGRVSERAPIGLQ